MEHAAASYRVEKNLMMISRRQFAVVFGAAMISGGCGLDALGETYSLSGRVSDTAAHPVPSATVTAKRMRDGKMYTARSNGDGVYTIPDLEGGDYKVWATAGELSARPVKVTLAAGETTDLVVSPSIQKK